MNEFVVATAQNPATKIIQEHVSIKLDRSEQIAFVTVLLDPPEPSERLRKAAERHRQQVGL